MISHINFSEILPDSPQTREKLGVENFLKSIISFQTISVKQGQVLCYEKTTPMGVFFIKNGKVKISKMLPLKKEKMVAILRNGEFIGDKEFFNNETYKYTAIAIENTELWFIPQSKYLSLFKKAEAWKFLNELINQPD